MDGGTLEFILILAGALVFVLVMRWLIRRVAFTYMTFAVPLDGKEYKYNRRRFTDPEGREVTDPATLERLREAWRQIELETAHDVARIQSDRF